LNSRVGNIDNSGTDLNIADMMADEKSSGRIAASRTSRYRETT
jgi:hypothetical protein